MRKKKNEKKIYISVLVKQITDNLIILNFSLAIGWRNIILALPAHLIIETGKIQ